jgi:NAD(P)-dependent dehydrogenase (short-subunit alcohol dehydrogenase family)
MPVSDRELQHLRALVTGGRKGIGHAVAARLRESGAKVLVTARTAPSGVPDTDFVASSAQLASVENAMSFCASSAAIHLRSGSIQFRGVVFFAST